MDAVLSFIKTSEFLIGVGVFVALIIIWLITRVVRKKRYLKQLNNLEIEINALRSTPIQYKINKAVGLMKVNQSVSDQVEAIQSQFLDVTNQYDRITFLLGSSEDEILSSHLKAGKEQLQELNDVYTEAKANVLELNGKLDRLLEDETRLRDSINDHKNIYRDYKVKYQSNLSDYNDTTQELENTMNDIEQMFSTFEEWMYASEYLKAQKQSEEIAKSVKEYGAAINLIPSLLEKAKGVVPHLLEEVTGQYQSISSKGVFLQHLEVFKNIQLISDSLKENLTNISKLRLDGVNESLDDSTKRLQQLSSAISKEDKAFDTVVGLSASAFTQLDQIKDEVLTLDEQIPSLNERYGFVMLSDAVQKMKDKEASLLSTKEKIQQKLTQEQIPSTSLQIELNEFNQEVSHLEIEIQEANRQVLSVRSDEQRAQKQLLKLHLIMNDISTKIESRHLPHINQQYDGDVAKARQMINQIDKVLAINPLDIESLNRSVNGSIDFIYRLYNNVNNLVGTVDMVENAIVYANKYRSTYPELDSELSRAEVSFRNGEYTYALKTVIYAIEKIKPGSPYEQLIMDNSRSA